MGVGRPNGDEYDTVALAFELFLLRMEEHCECHSVQYAWHGELG